MAEISIKALEPALLADYLDFFDRRAFADNPDWSACYCRCFQASSPAEWERLGAAENRAAAIKGIGSGATKGYLAYADGRAVGWCASDAKASYPMLANFPGAAGPGDARAAAIVCLIIEKNYRRMGIARALVEAAIDGARKAGFLAFEAYPRKPKEGEPMSDAEAYSGPLALYEALGFKKSREAGDRVVMSLGLA
jgi:GNAT superfamily N-acetyltransferase